MVGTFSSIPADVVTLNVPAEEGTGFAEAQLRDGFPAGFTNAFKVTSNVGLFDLAELGHFTKVDWYWMQSPKSGRVLRAEWEARYLARV